MRKVVVYMLVSADGVAEDPNHFLFEFDDVMEENLAEVIATQDTVLLGRETYEGWSEFWPESDIQPFADFINNVEKYVASSSPVQTEWPNTHRIEGPVVDFVRELKSGSGGDIGVHGSVVLAQSLLAAHVVDEIRLLVAPRVAADGKRLFQDGVEHTLELVKSTATPSSGLLVQYKVVPER